MKQRQDINPLLSGYRSNLKPSDADEKYLREARKIIRVRSREFIPDTQFMTQGSYLYRTLNRPCHPSQQMDLDDGMYAPRSEVDKAGLSSSQVLAQIAEHLRPLTATRKTWGEPQVKHSCVRIDIGNNKHVDIPFYRKAEGENISPADGPSHAEIYDEWGLSKYFDGSRPVVELATTDQGWKPSDSRNIIRWVAGCRVRRGRRFIYISRILKGWRDHQWPGKSPLPSILIMAMVEAAMEETSISVNSNEREDKALSDVVNVIADREIVRGDIEDPDKSVQESLNARLTDAQKNDCHNRFVALDRVLSAVLGGDGGDRKGDIKKLREQFGRFFPDDFSLITKCPLKAAAAATVTLPAAAKEGHHAFCTEFQGWGSDE